jgi:hypothetical protein
MPLGTQLAIDTDDSLRPRVELAVAGHVAGPHLTSEPLEVVELDSGRPPTGVLTLTSDGTDAVKITRMTVNDQAFVVSGFPALPAELAPGSSVSIAITYTGITPGQHEGIMDLDHDATESQTRFWLRASI